MSEASAQQPSAGQEAQATPAPMAKAYQPAEVEPAVYQRWLDADVFAPDGAGSPFAEGAAEWAAAAGFIGNRLIQRVAFPVTKLKNVQW